MTVRVSLFGGLRHAVGTPGMEIEMEEAATTASLVEVLRSRYPALEELSQLTVVSLNDVLANGSETLRDGDEVSLLSAVAGG